MKKVPFYHLLPAILLLLPLSLKAQIFPHHAEREMRAVWLTTFLGLDWPRTKATDEMAQKRQQAELTEMLDKLQDAGINTVLFQTRIRATVIYPSKHEPWDACLTGKTGRSPGYDPLAFAVDECHRRGMTLHAWVVALKEGDRRYADPSLAQTADRLSDVCREIVENYDIDGISFDYLRYPEVASTINDRRRYKADTRGLGYADWRRDNLTSVMRRIYNEVKAVKPWVWVSTSPVGKYADASRYSAGGWNARNSVCQDVDRWMREGIHDAIFPMMYFRGNNFYPFAMQWAEMAEDAGLSRSVVCPGLGIYFLSPHEKDWPLVDITRELEFMRREGMGQCYFRARFLTDNTKGLHDWLRLRHNRHPALPPAIPNADESGVGGVDSLTVTLHDMDHATLHIHGVAPMHNVYFVANGDTILVAGMVRDGRYSFSPRFLLSENGEIGVKTMSKYGVEGDFHTLTLKSFEKSSRVSKKSSNFAAQLGKSLISKLTKQ